MRAAIACRTAEYGRARRDGHRRQCAGRTTGYSGSDRVKRIRGAGIALSDERNTGRERARLSSAASVGELLKRKVGNRHRCRIGLLDQTGYAAQCHARQSGTEYVTSTSLHLILPPRRASKITPLQHCRTRQWPYASESNTNCACVKEKMAVLNILSQFLRSSSPRQSNAGMHAIFSLQRAVPPRRRRPSNE